MGRGNRGGLTFCTHAHLVLRVVSQKTLDTATGKLMTPLESAQV